MDLFARRGIVGERQDVGLGRVRPQFADADSNRQFRRLQVIELGESRFQFLVACLRLVLEGTSKSLVIVVPHLPHVLLEEQALVHRALRDRFAEGGLCRGCTSVDLSLEGLGTLLVKQNVHLGADICRGFLPLGLPATVLGALVFIQEVNFVVGGDVGKERLQPVVVRLENRVEFVVVALGAAVSQTHEYPTYGVGDVEQDFLAALH